MHYANTNSWFHIPPFDLGLSLLAPYTQSLQPEPWESRLHYPSPSPGTCRLLGRPSYLQCGSAVGPLLISNAATRATWVSSFTMTWLAKSLQMLSRLFSPEHQYICLNSKLDHDSFMLLTLQWLLPCTLQKKSKTSYHGLKSLQSQNPASPFHSPALPTTFLPLLGSHWFALTCFSAGNPPGHEALA